MNKTKLTLLLSLIFSSGLAYANNSVQTLLDNTPVITDSFNSSNKLDTKKESVNKDEMKKEESKDIIKESEYPVLPSSMNEETFKGMVVNSKKDFQLSNLDTDIETKYPESYKKSLSFLTSLNDTVTSFSFGDNKQTLNNTIYVFFDPQCPHCGDLWTASRNTVFKDKRFVWIPVAFMNDLSSVQSAAILMSKDPEQTMDSHEISLKNGYKGIVFNDSIPENIQNRIKVNSLFFSKLQVNSVPLVIHLNKEGQLDYSDGSMSNEELKLFVSK